MSATYLTPENASSRIINHSTELTAGIKVNNLKTNWWKQFIAFCASQEKNRFGWLAAAIALQACVMAPLALYTLTLMHSPFLFWIPCIAAFAATEVVNLAALSTRITIPVFFAGILVDVIVMIAAFTLL